MKLADVTDPRFTDAQRQQLAAFEGAEAAPESWHIRQNAVTQVAGHSAAPTGSEAEPEGVWIAFNWDGSAFVPFASELEALRHASSYHMPVKFVEFGDEEWMRR